MRKFASFWLLMCLPILAFADSGSLSFAPPAGDYSVVFLGNIFGIVDGVLHGTGSQILGKMFAVFNSAVLALGGMVIMYTLIVSTLKTAQEGEMMGKQWSSLWIPIRSTLGLALLIPKASGYCLMQVFVMWIVVQGVGAADKVWDAALGYLNRGGVIIQAQVDPTKSLLGSASSGVSRGAQVLLAGQVCMLGLQRQLENQLQGYQKQKNAKSGPCFGTPSKDMQDFCGGSVPNFINTVNFVTEQNRLPGASQYSLPMPNFPTTSPYSALNGICGKLTWNSFSSDLTLVKKNIKTLSAGDIDTASMSRVIAIQQMYLDLTSVATEIINNNPQLMSRQQGGNNQNKPTLYSSIATQQFGVPHTANGSICENNATPNCVLWDSASGASGAVLLDGTEFQDALTDYDGIMVPALTLAAQAKDAESANSSRQFIQQATTQGWIMAGSYFFNLITLNNAGTSGGGLMDSNTGMEQSSFDVGALSAVFSGSGSNIQCSGMHAVLCTWLNRDPSSVIPVAAMINGTGLGIDPIAFPDLSSGKQRDVIDGVGSSTVYGYTNNATILQLPGQPGIKPLQFANLIHVSVDPSLYYLPKANIECGKVKILFFKVCLGQMFGNIFYNYLFRLMYNFFLTLFQQFIKQVIMAFLMVPLEAMSSIFKDGVQIIATPGVNPIVALANMGTYYINFVSNLWLMLVELGITAILIPFFGIFILIIIAMVMPLLFAWLGVMEAIGFTTAYYVPLVPYMIFTFGSIAWLMAVIEAMVAAPIVALGVTHPEGHEAFGKGEGAILILMNVFLRPSMMIIGYIASIALCYVSVWIINAGFDNAIGFIQGSDQFGTGGSHDNWGASNLHLSHPLGTGPNMPSAAGPVQGGYTGWAGVFAYFFSILTYTTLYLTVVQKAFTLITVLPDKVLRWIGGQQESFGADVAQWGDEAKGKIGEGAKDTMSAQSQMGQTMFSKVGQGSSSESSGNVSASSDDSATSDAANATSGGGPAKEAGKGAGEAAEVAAVL